MLPACKHFDRMRGTRVRACAYTRCAPGTSSLPTRTHTQACAHIHRAGAGAGACTRSRQPDNQPDTSKHTRTLMSAAVAELTSSGAGSSWSRWRLRESSPSGTPNDRWRALRRDAVLCPTFVAGVSSYSMTSCSSCRRLWSRIKASRDCIFVPLMKTEISMPKITWNVQASEECC